jgi:hypothetical protein
VRLLAQTEREARRQFNLSPQWIDAVMGAVILVAYGSLWLSTRRQHPYTGPSLGVVALVYAAVAVALAVSVKVYRRATAGVSGPSVRRQQVEGSRSWSRSYSAVPCFTARSSTMARAMRSSSG